MCDAAWCKTVVVVVVVLVLVDAAVVVVKKHHATNARVVIFAGCIHSTVRTWMRWPKRSFTARINAVALLLSLGKPVWHITWIETVALGRTDWAK